MVTDTIGRLRKVKEVLDHSDSGGTETDMSEAPTVKVYPIQVADPESVLKVLQTTLAGVPDVRLMVDTKSGFVVAQARPSQHALIRNVVNQMEGRDAMSSNNSKIQFIPLPGRSTQDELLKKLQGVWWATHPDSIIRVVTPSASDDSPSGRFAVPPGGMIDERHSQPTSTPDPSSLRVPPAQRPLHQTNPAPLKTPATSNETSPSGPSEIRSYRIDNSAAVPKSYLHFVSKETEKDDPQAAAEPTPTALVNTDVRTNPADATAAGEKAKATDTPQAEKIEVKPEKEALRNRRLWWCQDQEDCSLRRKIPGTQPIQGTSCDSSIATDQGPTTIHCFLFAPRPGCRGDGNSRPGFSRHLVVRWRK